MKILQTALLLVAFAATPTLARADDAFEACTTEGSCALRVTDNQTGADVWLVTDEQSPLQNIWPGTYWLVSGDDYAEIAAMIPAEQHVTLPGVNPTTGERAKGGTAPAPGGKGPLVGASVSVGNITIGGGGGEDSCKACHTGSLKDIHKKVIEKKG